ncbi:dethiobiotin synthase [Cohnella faecalis]|uniref:ATP-dependent dethiobiotin synthetase BioD n=1 Tax=Cohnella faecalis TaxID=2315694 RepID=A0A398CKT0_9BACL|nr:dethiobiotin synthase [Cohnella faecalis]RIE02985.1 dethiobiotin synthase [Cohnella faecalis]
MSRGVARKLRGLFVTGTDTNVGKTIVTAAITAVLRAEGRNVGIWKPVQSGALLGSGATDAERLLQWTGIRERPGAVSPYTFEAPLAPLLAAQKAGLSLTLQEVIAAGEPLVRRYESLLIEGAGGVAVPLTADALVADLIAELRIPALIVARSGLGTINHTLLTVSYLRQLKVPITGIILNDGECGAGKDDPSVASNAEQIERYSGIPVLGRFPRLPGGTDREALVNAVCQKIRIAPIREAIEMQSKEDERG